MSTTMNLVAEGNISPCRFVKVGSATNTALQAAAGNACVGISMNFTNTVSLEGAVSITSSYIATSGQSVSMWGFGSEALLELGGTVSAGGRLKSDANGKGVAAATADNAYAVTMQSGVSGDFVRVQIVYDTVGAA